MTKDVHKNRDEISAALLEKSDELNEIPNLEQDQDGFIHASALILKDFIIFPKMISPIFITDAEDVQVIFDVLEKGTTLVGMLKRSGEEDFYPIGIEFAIGKLVDLGEGNYSALIQGRRRVRIHTVNERDAGIILSAEPLSEVRDYPKTTKALSKITMDLFTQCVQLDRSLPEDIGVYVMNISDINWQVDLIASAISLPLAKRIEILQLEDIEQRLHFLNTCLVQELDVLQIEDDLHSKVQREVDKNQREFYLREQVKAIQMELGERDLWEQEVVEYQQKLAKVSMPDEIKRTANKELARLKEGPSFSPEMGIIRNYLDWLIDLPWTEETTDNLDINHAIEILNHNHYGLEKAKDRILEYLAVESIGQEGIKQPILCFVGPPGTGKTSLGRSIAQSLGRKFVRLSLGGIRDEAEIRGHRRTYIGALPGRIIQTMRRAGTANPIFMLDEIDKIGNDFRGDPAAALLEVLDKEQNYAFSDHYLELPYDLSRIMFITTANSTDTIPSALLDRMETIDFPGYIEEEKIEITKKFLLPRQLEENGLKNVALNVPDEAISRIIRDYTYEAGVRNLEREIGKILRKITRKYIETNKIPTELTDEMIEEFLGPPKFFFFEAEKEDEVGAAVAIAWTENGGEIMPVEVLITDGKGNLQITGQVGNVMQESAQASLSYLKSKSLDLKLKKLDFDKIDIHIHIPEGAIPKDGPSAGVTITTALVSALTKRKVYKDIGMTGEITLRGKVLPVGGIREKLTAAKRAGIKRVLIPRKNEKDLVDIPPAAMQGLEIIKVDHLDEVLEISLYPVNG
ncbi:MAG: endopeptidase La [Chloroflexi bacterium]|nr:endopeptidase La [Chloroflexota bacterium]